MWQVIIALIALVALVMAAIWGVLNARERITAESAKIRKFGMVLTVVVVALVLLFGTRVVMQGLLVVFPLGWMLVAAIGVYTASVVWAQQKEN
jgi:hypothetical protein